MTELENYKNELKECTNRLNHLFSTIYKKYELLQFYLDKYIASNGKKSEKCNDSNIRQIENLGQEIVCDQSEICTLIQKIMSAKNKPQFGLRKDPYYHEFSNNFINMMDNLSEILGLYHDRILHLNPEVFDIFQIKKCS